MKKLLLILFIVAIPTLAFATLIDNGNGTVSDSSTDVMWTRLYMTGKTYTEATSEASSCTIGGYSDWRLPTQSELESLIDSNYYPQTSPLFNLKVRDPSSWTFWTSSGGGSGESVFATRYLGVYFGDGSTISLPYTARYSVRFARQGEGSYVEPQSILWSTAGDTMLWSTGGDTIAWN